jgi:hypothetical protein
MIRSVAAIVVAAITTTACVRTSGPDCRDETRALDLTARLTVVGTAATPNDTATANVSLHEARHASTKVTSAREMLWFVAGSIGTADVTGVHVHERGTGRLLMDIPLTGAEQPPSVITRVFTRVPYSGPTDWDELYNMLGNQRGYVDVHTRTYPDGQLRGDLRPRNATWQTYTHAYCS